MSNFCQNSTVSMKPLKFKDFSISKIVQVLEKNSTSTNVIPLLR